jgi:hypothetical protein
MNGRRRCREQEVFEIFRGEFSRHGMIFMFDGSAISKS